MARGLLSNGRICLKRRFLLSRWILPAPCCFARRAERRRLAQMNPAAAPSTAGRAGQSGVPAAGSAIGDHRPRRRRSGQGRANPPLPGFRRQTAERTRSRHLAGQAHGLRQFRVLLAVLEPTGAMRSGQQPDPADAGQSGPDHDQPRAAAQRRPSGAPTATISAARSCWRWRRTIADRNMPTPRAASGNFLENMFGNGAPSRARRPTSARNPAPTAPSAPAAATAPIFRSRLRPCPPASPTTKRPARRSARRRKRPSSPTAIPART